MRLVDGCVCEECKNWRGGGVCKRNLVLIFELGS